MATVTQSWGLESAMASLLDEMTRVQEALLSLLRRRREAMSRGDLSELEQVGEMERGIHAELGECLKRREALLVEARQAGLEGKTLAEVARRFPEERAEAMDRKMGESRKLVEEVRLESLTNWVVAQRSLLYVSQMLEIIATGGRIRPTYLSSDALTRGSLVDQEA